MILAAVTLAVLTAVHLPVTTSAVAAQALVDRGLFFYYAFDGGDAVTQFADAAASDPHLAMAFWGEALAEGPDLNTAMTPQHFDLARAAIARAVALESYASPRERAYIDAMALRYKGTWANWPADEASYRTAMLQLAQSGDVNARLLAAEAFLENGRFAWSGDRPASPDTRRALDLVDGVLADDPNSVMANHLCLHLYDQAPDRAPARACAQRLDAATFPPQAEHLAHMPAHYWIETGDYAAAAAASDRAYALFQRLESIPNHDTDHDRYLLHDVYVGYSATMMLGSYAVARLWASRMASAYGTPYDALTALRFGRFDDAYALAAGSTPTDLAIRGYSALQLGRLSEARGIAARLRNLAAPGDVAELFFARVAEHDANYDAASRWIGRAVDEQHNAFSDELIPLLPAVEARGGLALRRSEYDDAAAAFEAALAAYPNDPRALFGLAAALSASGHAAGAAQAQAQFETLWSGADTTLDAGALL